MLLFSTLASVAALLPLASAHGIVDDIIAGGQPWSGKNPWVSVHSPAWSADNKDYGYVWDVNHINMTCHRGATPGTQYIPLAAGSNVKVKWSGSWPHPGPTMSYLAKCQGSCTKANPADLKFFKIHHSGLLQNPNATSKDPYWGAYTIRDNNNTAVIKLPTNISPGNYVLRHEIIALHSAFNETGVQFYPQCINLKVSGGGNLQPEGVPATKLYGQKDPGILINIWWPSPTKYAIPGPTVAAGLQFKGGKKFKA
ncbi:putative glycosyl hydrolase family 61 protein 5 [Elsinoe fawcettii]|nr:putative glycosyl hydrolase family 61 protein 5 [Elsinoe fawcettii]